MRVLFWGTPQFAVPSLEALLQSSHEVVGLVTQPDRPRGRSSRPAASATTRRLLAAQLPIPILQPEKPRGAEFLDRIGALAPDVSVVVAYGNLLPQRVLDFPPAGSLNVHASLLPRHRGAAPVTAAILAGDAVTGVTLMRMDAGLDTGPILLQRPLTVGPEQSSGELTSRLAGLGAEVLLEGLDQLERGTLREVPQPSEGATYAPRVTTEDARIRWSQPAVVLERMLRAYDPSPGAFTLWDGRRLKLFRGRVADVEADRALAPGEVTTNGTSGLLVGTGVGALEVHELQLEGKPRMSAREFVRGRKLAPATRFE